jgi:hypothetical protein
MNIIKFNKFLNEAIQIPVIDILIDNDGNLYNGDFPEFPLTKGNIVRNQSRVPTDILGNDGRSYPAGIDKNGDLVCVNIGNNGIALNTEGNPLRIPQNIIDFYPKLKFKFWRTKGEHGFYKFLVPILPTGWVNVKIDMEVLKRVRRYSKNLGTNNKKFKSFISKLEDLERMSSGVLLRKRKREKIQKEMSVIILLHYINEIKDFFTPGSSGFLFESFLAGLIPNAVVLDDNSKCDVRADGIKYQSKLIDNLGSVEISPEEVDYNIICLKYPDKIEIYILDNDFESDNYYDDFRETDSITANLLKSSTHVKKYTIEINNIEEKIKTIANGLKESLDSLYGELSQFQYNVESIITGVNQKGKILTGEEFTSTVNNSQVNINNMTNQLGNLVHTIMQNN